MYSHRKNNILKLHNIISNKYYTKLMVQDKTDKKQHLATSGSKYQQVRLITYRIANTDDDGDKLPERQSPNNL